MLGKGVMVRVGAVVGLRSSVIDTMSWRRCVQITVCAMIMIIMMILMIIDINDLVML